MSLSPDFDHALRRNGSEQEPSPPVTIFETSLIRKHEKERKPTVVIWCIDDDPGILQLLNYVLNEELSGRVDARFFPNGEAMQKYYQELEEVGLARSLPQIVITDYNLGIDYATGKERMHGLSIGKFIKNNTAAEIILLTGDAREIKSNHSEKALYEDFGISEVWGKPFDIDEIIDTLSGKIALDQERLKLQQEQQVE